MPSKYQKALSPKQKRFVDEYLIDTNATAAYKRAGYKCQGRAAENAASRMLGFVGDR
jgi:phage terminase small subunit